MKNSILLGFLSMACFATLLLTSFNAEAMPGSGSGNMAYYKAIKITVLIGATHDISSTFVPPSHLISKDTKITRN